MTAAEAKSYEKEAEKNGELEPRVRKKRSDAGAKRRQGDDSGSDSSGEVDRARPTKGAKRRKAADDESEEGLMRMRIFLPRRRSRRSLAPGVTRRQEEARGNWQGEAEGVRSQ